MPSDSLADLTHLQEQEERAVEAVEGRRRELATAEALLEDAKRLGKATDAIEARMRAAEGEVARAERESAAIREKVVAAERALPADLRDDEA